MDWTSMARVWSRKIVGRLAVCGRLVIGPLETLYRPGPPNVMNAMWGGPPVHRGARRSALPQNPAVFVDVQPLIGRHTRKSLLRPARPFHLDRRRGVGAQPERERQIALRTVARPAAYHVPLPALRAFHPHHRPDAVAVRLRPRQPHAQPVVAIPAVI